VSGPAPLGARAPALRDGRPLPPPVAAVPALPNLLDADAVAAVLERALRAGTEIDRVRVRAVDYRPGSGATVAYDVIAAGRHRVAVAATGAAGGAAARTPARLAIARSLGADAPVTRPLTYDAGLGALVHWYPLDLAMPVIAKPPGDLVRLLGRAGIAADEPPGPPETLLYRPGCRAVLRLGHVVLKAYADDTAFGAGVAGLRIAGGLRLLRGPRLQAAFPELRLTVQPALDGDSVGRLRALDVAPVAGTMLRVVHESAVRGLPVSAPGALLRHVRASVTLVAAVEPALAGLARDLLARLEEHSPEPAGLVVSHGDFNVSQFLDVDGTLAVLDFDEACLAPPALDAASYGANLVGGRTGDLGRAHEALDALLDGAGARPAHLDWYLAALLLRRAGNPFRLQKRRWPQRIASMLAAAEEVLRA
jgi:hypothetical protein